MKPTSTAIQLFIQDFNLMDENGVVNFEANIEFKSGNVASTIKSDVFILSVNPKNVDSINLLNNEISTLNYPMMYQSGKEVFSYIDGVCLIIIGNNAEKGDYVVSVFPEKTSAKVTE